LVVWFRVPKKEGDIEDEGVAISPPAPPSRDSSDRREKKKECDFGMDVDMTSARDILLFSFVDAVKSRVPRLELIDERGRYVFFQGYYVTV
jgi:hypothetical protein